MTHRQIPDAFATICIGSLLALLCVVVAMSCSSCSSTHVRTAEGAEYQSRVLLLKRHIKEAQLGPGNVLTGYKGESQAEQLAQMLDVFSRYAVGMAEIQARPLPAPVQAVPVAPAVVPDPAPVLVPEPGQSEPLDVDLPAGDWAVRFEVRGLVKEPGPAGDGKAEHIFADLRGAGFRRVLLMNMDGNRELRAYIDPPGDEINQPEPEGGQAVVIIERVGERLTVEIGGESWVDRVLTGTPRLLVVGGTKEDARRVFKGDWRGLQTIFTGAGQ